MIDYLLNNKEWLFSGIGITIAGFLIYGILWLCKRFKTNPSFDQDEYKTLPHPREIKGEIDKAPPCKRFKTNPPFDQNEYKTLPYQAVSQLKFIFLPIFKQKVFFYFSAW